MSITAGNDIVASDFVGTSSGASDSGKVAKLDASGKIPTGFLRFGGDGSDGALSISSGTTTISIASASLLVKNYTSISITGTGKLAFSNPANNGSVVVLKSQGNVTLTSSQAPMIDCSGLGSAETYDAYIGNFLKNTCGGGGNNPTYSNTALGGIAGTISLSLTTYGPQANLLKYLGMAFIGSAGGGGINSSGGSGDSPVPGNGGRGGGCLIIECGGAWNFTTSGGISVAGKNGTAATGANGGASGHVSSGGGGGGGGFCLCLYNTLTANSGTITITAGTGGTGSGTASGGSAVQASGGGGGAGKASGTAAGDIHQTNSTGGQGADGGVGFSLVAQNTEYA